MDLFSEITTNQWLRLVIEILFFSLICCSIYIRDLKKELSDIKRQKKNLEYKNKILANKNKNINNAMFKKHLTNGEFKSINDLLIEIEELKNK